MLSVPFETIEIRLSLAQVTNDKLERQQSSDTAKETSLEQEVFSLNEEQFCKIQKILNTPMANNLALMKLLDFKPPWNK
jgi:hypothetical protein